MKKLLSLVSMLFVFGICNQIKSQTLLNENFDSYNTSQLLTAVSPTWLVTFVGFPFEMGTISSAESNSPQNSLQQDGGLFIMNDFGATVSTGVINTQMALKIPSGKKFMFQFGDPGTMVLFSNGTFTVYDLNMVAITSPVNYPESTWFQFRIEANYDLSIWKNYIDNQQVGVPYTNFSQPSISNLQFRAFNPVASDPFNFEAWIDDISVIKTASSLPNLDLAVVQTQPDYGVVSQQKKVKTRIKNIGQTVINSATVTMNYDNGAVISVQNLSNLNLQSLDNKIIEFNDPVVLNNAKTIMITISNINGGSDDNASNNSNNYLISGLITPAANKKIYIEEGTGTWCGFCPSARVDVEWLTHTFGEFVEVAELHDTDPMATSSYNPIALGMTGYPTVLIDRDTNFNISFLELDYTNGVFQNNLYLFPMNATDFLNRLQVLPHAIVNPTYTYNTTTRALAVTVDYQFNAATANYKVACALTEDHLSGPGDGSAMTLDFDQINYLSGNNHIINPDNIDLYDLPSPIPATQMIYDHVGRIISPSISGVGISNTTAGQTVTQTFNFVVDQNWNPANIKIIAMLIDDSGHVDNVQTALLADAFLNVNNVVTNTADFAIYPNPVSDKCVVRFSKALEEQAEVTIAGIDGRIVKTLTLNPGKDTDTFEIDLRMLIEGNYVVNVQQGNALQSIKLIKID